VHRAVLARVGMHRVALVLVLLVALGVRLYRLDAKSLWFDELISWGIASEGILEVLDSMPAFGGNNGLYYFLLGVWVQLFPALSESVLRFPSVVFGVAGVWALYALGSELFDRRVGLAAAALLAVNPFQVAWSQDARGYSLWMLLATLSFLALARVGQVGATRTRWAAYATWTVLSCFAHLYMGFVLMAQAFYALVATRLWRRRAVMLVALAIVLLIAPLVYWSATRYSGQLDGLPALRWKQAQELAALFSGDDPLLLLVLGSLVAFGLTLSLWRSWRDTRERAAVLLVLCWGVLTPLIVAALSEAWMGLYLGRYLAAIQPPLVLLAGLGLARLRPTSLAVVVYALATALALSALWGEYAPRPPEDFRGGMARMAAEMRPGDGAVFISKTTRAAWNFYAPRFGRDPDDVEEADKPLWIDPYGESTHRVGFERQQLFRLARSHPRIWLVRSHEYEPDGRGGKQDASRWVRHYLEDRGYVGTKTEHEGVLVTLYEARSRT
jgi:mannosyltransferase